MQRQKKNTKKDFGETFDSKLHTHKNNSQEISQRKN